MTKTYWVYEITNPLQQVYVGITTNIKKREQAYRLVRCKRQRRIYLSIRKHGWHNHGFVVLVSGISRNQAEETEKRLIAMYKAAGVSLNTKDGGLDYDGVRPNTALAPVVQFSISGEYLRKWDYVVDACNYVGVDSGLIGNACKVGYRTNYAMGYLWQYEADYKKGVPLKYNPKERAVLQFTEDGRQVGVYSSCSDASRQTGVNLHGIICAAAQKYASNWSHGYLWCYESDYTSFRDLMIPINGRAVVAATLDGGFIGKWISAAEAERTFLLRKGSITEACQDRAGIVVGFIWQYASLYEDGFKKEYYNNMGENTPRRARQIKTYRQLIVKMDKEARENGTYNCFFCGEPIKGACEHHHLHKRIEDDLTDGENIVLVHAVCHREYHDLPVRKQKWREIFMENLRAKDPQTYYKEREKENK